MSALKASTTSTSDNNQPPTNPRPLIKALRDIFVRLSEEQFESEVALERQRRRGYSDDEARKIDHGITNISTKPAIADAAAPQTAAGTSDQGSKSNKKRAAPPLVLTPSTFATAAAAAATHDESNKAENEASFPSSNSSSSSKKLKIANTATAGTNNNNNNNNSSKTKTELRLDAAWEQSYQELLKFQKQFGHVDIKETKDKACPHYKLSLWVANQRKRFANRQRKQQQHQQQQQQQQHQQTAAGAGAGNGAATVQGDQEAELLHTIHHTEVTNRTNAAKRKGTMTDEQVVRLASMGGFRFTNKHFDFETRLEQLQQYKDTNDGSTRVPRAYQEFDKLGRWVQRIKCDYHSGTLPANRVARLDAIVFDWEKRQAPNGFGKNHVKNKKKAVAGKDTGAAAAADEPCNGSSTNNVTGR